MSLLIRRDKSGEVLSYRNQGEKQDSALFYKSLQKDQKGGQKPQ